MEDHFQSRKVKLLKLLSLNIFKVIRVTFCVVGDLKMLVHDAPIDIALLLYKHMYKGKKKKNVKRQSASLY